MINEIQGQDRRDDESGAGTARRRIWGPEQRDGETRGQNREMTKPGAGTARR